MRKAPRLLVTLAAALLALGLLSFRPSGGAGPRPVSVAEIYEEVTRLATSPPVAEALSRVDRERGELLSQWISLASTPSSSGHEGARAELVERTLRSCGLESVRRAAAGNVIGVIPGRDRSAKAAIFMAHMDTVAQPGADFTVRRESGRLIGPGVRDDSSGLAALLAAARIVRQSAVTPPADRILVASVEEEIGLRGSRAFLDAAGRSVGAFVAVDGYLGQISYAATTILWTRMHFRAAGSHTLTSHEHPSATLAAAKAIEAIYAIPLKRRPEELESWLNVGMLGGGEVPNAQARDAWFTVDLRCNDPRVAAELEDRIMEACRRAADEVGVGFDVEVLQRLEGARIEGHHASRVVRTARAVLDHLGWRNLVITPRGNADHNVAIQRGIPAIALGVTTGDKAHTPEELAEIAPYSVGVKQLILLIASPLH
jgi:acetylornithine deacetylase/succinyl-diaminopimelate desuccinylase-like protein